MKGRFASNPYYVEYETLLTALARLMAEGKGDTPEADAIRDAMEHPERELIREELERLNGLSADLYMLVDDEVHDPLAPGEDPSVREPDRLRACLDEAWRRPDGAEATLSLLRKGTANLSQAQRAYRRSRAYEALGHLDTALVFSRHAVERDSDNNSYKWLLLTLLDRLQQYDEFQERVREYIESNTASPELRVYAASRLFSLTRKQPYERFAPILERVVLGLETMLPTLESSSEPLASDLSAYGQLTLGFCYQRLSRREAALNAFSRAMHSPKFRSTALVARGMLLLAESRQEALADFEQAVADGTPLVAPYIHLAHDALTQNNYARCLPLCDQALDRTRDSRLRAVVLQWEAIAGFELKAPIEQVHRMFEVALTLDPINPEIQHNFEVLRQQEHSQAASRSVSIQWQIPMAPEVETSTPEIDAADLLPRMTARAA